MKETQGPAMQEVSSSNIRRVGWETDQLTVEFHHGGVYVYDKVPKSVFDDMVSAPSVGSFFAKNVRDSYKYERVQSQAAPVLS